MFGRAPVPTREDWLRIGRLEADVANLQLQWQSYRDELNRLVQRLEKRDQRAERRQDAPGPTIDEGADAGVPAGLDPVSAKIWRRRKGALPRHGLAAEG